MEQEFRTTFIPKKPIAPTPVSSSGSSGKPVGIFFVIALIIFITTLAAAGGAYLYKSYLKGEVASLVSSLELVQKKIDSTFIKEATTMDKRLKNADTLLNQHTVVAPLFIALSQSTLPAVRYTKLDLSFDENKNMVAKLSGESDGYRSIALQSQALSEKTSLKNIIFSNFVVTPKGRVSFDVSFTLPITDLSFEKFLENNPVQTSTIPTESITTQESINNTIDIDSVTIDTNNSTTDITTETAQTDSGVDGIVSSPR
jgi:flagellar basal body-associated protein FliL